MKPYGNEHKDFGEGLNSTKTGQTASKSKSSSRRMNKKIRRAKDKAAIRKDQI